MQRIFFNTTKQLNNFQNEIKIYSEYNDKTYFLSYHVYRNKNKERTKAFI